MASHTHSGWSSVLSGFHFTFLLLVIVGGGCELFTTRDPQAPLGSNGEGWNLPLTPRDVLSNMENAIGRRSDVDYMHSFSSTDAGLPDYAFIADPQAIADNPGRFENWGFAEETRYAQTLFNPANLPLDSLSTVTFNVSQERVIGDSARINAGYSLHLGHLRTAPRSMEGQLEFNLLRGNDGGWYIQRWSDLRTGGDACWSDLKAKF